ncbi:hypothetical protein ES703_71410 [subsurface metagenome]
MDKEKLFVEILKENWQHARHIETERMWFVNIFAAIIVGTIAYLSEVGLEVLPLIILIVFALFCLLVTIKLNIAFATHMKAIESIFKDKKLLLGDKKEWRTYMGMPSRKGKIWKILSVAKLTVFFYSLAIIVLGVMIICINCNLI